MPKYEADGRPGEGRRLADVIEARPHELARHPGIVLHHLQLQLGQHGPGRPVDVVGRALRVHAAARSRTGPRRCVRLYSPRVLTVEEVSEPISFRWPFQVSYWLML